MTYSVDGKTAETGTMNLTNLTPDNVRKGVNIAGIVGTHTDITEETGELKFENNKWVNVTPGYQATLIRENYNRDIPQLRYLWELTVDGLKNKPRGILVYGKYINSNQIKYISVVLGRCIYYGSFIHTTGSIICTVYNGHFRLGVEYDDGYSPLHQYFSSVFWRTYS